MSITFIQPQFFLTEESPQNFSHSDPNFSLSQKGDVNNTAPLFIYFSSKLCTGWVVNDKLHSPQKKLRKYKKYIVS